MVMPSSSICCTEGGRYSRDWSMLILSILLPTAGSAARAASGNPPATASTRNEAATTEEEGSASRRLSSHAPPGRGRFAGRSKLPKAVPSRPRSNTLGPTSVNRFEPPRPSPKLDRRRKRPGQALLCRATKKGHPMAIRRRRSFFVPSAVVAAIILIAASASRAVAVSPLESLCARQLAGTAARFAAVWTTAVIDCRLAAAEGDGVHALPERRRPRGDRPARDPARDQGEALLREPLLVLTRSHLHRRLSLPLAASGRRCRVVHGRRSKPPLRHGQHRVSGTVL